MFPQSLLNSVRHRLARRRMRQLAKLPIEDAFDQIYEQRLWSNDCGQLSGAGSYGRAADEYVAILTRFIEAHDVQSILDIGCGDFNVGARLAPLVATYHALDVSARIIDSNKGRFASMANVEFRQLNACIEPLPKTDLVTVRQVLQHLSNAQIEMILRNIERTRPKFALITEHQSQTHGFPPNVDLPGHSSLTRLAIGSAVVLDAPPFARQTSLAATIKLSASENGPDADAGILSIWLLQPQP